MLVTIILFLLIFGVVVISHEFGHYIIGRRNGIRVLEFSVGMGPTLFSFEKGGTKYSVKLLPLGGACMFDGEDGNFQEELKTEQAAQECGEGLLRCLRGPFSTFCWPLSLH